MTHSTESEPLWDEAGFTAFLHGLATDDAPRLFAVAVEYGHRHDGHIAAYGMAFHDHAEVISTTGDFRASLQTPEIALTYFEDDGTTPRLVWLPDAPVQAATVVGTTSSR
ncbi:hypothetical protein [Saccharothrix australiensis]|uniref:Uncharacterized protein n=1 Tax=Saccharothrix australiensis TaxID=2072 RepID=A0A495VT12_9PSEU|nr:hypothetical protein [Saccharothrix australiensis]RKT52472.1 hypothetical protein C8E97_0986 [Saccharothrix australiensis]